jgi:Icc-related predicted phosphoesterase
MISQDNPVRAIAAIVEHMNINSMGFDHSEIKSTGRRSYSPVDMFKLYAYSYYSGIRSSRKIEQESHRNIEVMWLIGNLAPDFKTIADFRKNNSEAIQKAFLPVYLKYFSVFSWLLFLGFQYHEFLLIHQTSVQDMNSRYLYLGLVCKIGRAVLFNQNSNRCQIDEC